MKAILTLVATGVLIANAFASPFDIPGATMYPDPLSADQPTWGQFAFYYPRNANWVEETFPGANGIDPIDTGSHPIRFDLGRTTPGPWLGPTLDVYYLPGATVQSAELALYGILSGEPANPAVPGTLGLQEVGPETTQTAFTISEPSAQATPDPRLPVPAFSYQSQSVTNFTTFTDDIPGDAEGSAHIQAPYLSPATVSALQNVIDFTSMDKWRCRMAGVGNGTYNVVFFLRCPPSSNFQTYAQQLWLPLGTSTFNPPVILKRDTIVKVQVEGNVSTVTARDGDVVSLQIADNVYSPNGNVFLAKGSPAFGYVARAYQAGPIGHNGYVAINISYALAVDGTPVEFYGPDSYQSRRKLDVNRIPDVVPGDDNATSMQNRDVLFIKTDSPSVFPDSAPSDKGWLRFVLPSKSLRVRIVIKTVTVPVPMTVHILNAVIIRGAAGSGLKAEDVDGMLQAERQGAHIDPVKIVNPIVIYPPADSSFPKSAYQGSPLKSTTSLLGFSPGIGGDVIGILNQGVPQARFDGVGQSEFPSQLVPALAAGALAGIGDQIGTNGEKRDTSLLVGGVTALTVMGSTGLGAAIIGEDRQVSDQSVFNVLVANDTLIVPQPASGSSGGGGGHGGGGAGNNAGSATPSTASPSSSLSPNAPAGKPHR